MSEDLSGRPRVRLNLESLRKEAKQWLRTLRGIKNDSADGIESDSADGIETDSETNAARDRLRRTFDPIPETITLRDVQHALAREHGFPGWTDLRQSLNPDSATVQKALQQFEEKAQALFDAYHLGTPEALERHYRLTWHRRAWQAMRAYVQLDLGKRPQHEGDDVPITIEDARYLIAIEHQFESWDDLQAFVEQLPAGYAITASPVGVASSRNDDATPLISSREWGRVLEILREHPDAVLHANGQMTDEMLAQVAQIPHITSLRLDNCKQLTDDGVRHLASLPNLRELDLSSTRVTDDGLRVLRQLPQLRSLGLVMTMVTDKGLAHLEHCNELERLHLMWTHTGDGALRALAGKQKFTHLWSGNNMTDDGLSLLHELPQYKQWHGGEGTLGILREDNMPTQLLLRGAITDRGVAKLRELNGLTVLHLDDCALSDSAQAVEPLTTLAHLAKFGTDPKNAWMSVIARMPALRFLGIQDAEISDAAWVDLGASQSIENIWGRRNTDLRSTGFRALGRMPRLRGLSVSCKHVDDDALAMLPDFPALRELMPMDVPDASYRHIGKCTELEALLLMYCRDTTDAATEHITGLSKLLRYFNSYTTISDRTPQLLSAMDSLEKVSLVACNNLTNAGVTQLARLPNLKELEISGNALTPAVQKSFGSRVKVKYSH